jgi:copper chaperone CopZ
VTRALKGVNGVSDVRVDLGQKQAVVTHAGANIEAMKTAVDDAGYEVVGVA